MLSDFQRKAREYIKKDDEYWSGGIRENQSKRPRLSTPEQTAEAVGQHEVAEMTPEVLKVKLKDLGVKTKVRNIKRLQELYEAALKAASN